MSNAVKLAIIALLCSPAYAVQDAQPHDSPNGAFTVANVGDTAQPDHYFQIRDREGRVLLSSTTHQLLESGSFANSISWSSDSRFVAFSVRTSGPSIHDTFVYSTRTKELLRVPTSDDDYQTTPVRWRNARTLIVQTSGPVGGKATDDRSYYRYRRTIRISESPLRYEILYDSRGAQPTP